MMKNELMEKEEAKEKLVRKFSSIIKIISRKIKEYLFRRICS